MLELISLIINLLLGSGLVGTLIFFRSKRRKEGAEADKTEIQASVEEFGALKMQIEYFSNQLEGAYNVTENQQQIIDSLRVTINEIKRRYNDLELRLMQEEHARKLAERDKCTKECPDRVPPRASIEFTRNNQKSE